MIIRYLDPLGIESSWKCDSRGPASDFAIFSVLVRSHTRAERCCMFREVAPYFMREHSNFLQDWLKYGENRINGGFLMTRLPDSQRFVDVIRIWGPFSLWAFLQSAPYDVAGMKGKSNF